MKALILACTVGAALLSAQAPRLTFDVTSVKPNTSGEQGGTSRAEPGRYVGVNVTLRRVARLAYSPAQELVGGPDWIDTARFDIEGKANGAPSREQMQEMLRALLADRFGLVVHRETRQMPAYALELARPDGRLGPDLRATQPCAGPGCGGFSVGNGSMQGRGATMARLAGELASATDGRHVVDRTGLTGTFDVALRWNVNALAPDAAAADGPPSIFAAIQEQLGLRLEPITAPIEVIVIDRAEKPQPD